MLNFKIDIYYLECKTQNILIFKNHSARLIGNHGFDHIVHDNLGLLDFLDERL